MIKHVAPADPGATIPDPQVGDALPPEGRAVPWNAHWALMELRGDVTVSDPPPEPEGPLAAPADQLPAEPG